VWVWDWKTLRLLLTIPPNDTNTAKHSSMIEFAASAPILFLTSAKSKYITGIVTDLYVSFDLSNTREPSRRLRYAPQ